MMASDPVIIEFVDVMYIFPDSVVKSMLTSSIFRAADTFDSRLVLMPILDSGVLAASDYKSFSNCSTNGRLDRSRRKRICSPWNTAVMYTMIWASSSRFP